MVVLGLDIGGTGIKGAIVDTESGEMLTERYRLLTPQPATPKAMIVTIGEIVSHFGWQGPVGCGFPSAIKNGVVLTAANVSKKWIGFNLEEALRELTGCNTVVLNDADAAGMAVTVGPGGLWAHQETARARRLFGGGALCQGVGQRSVRPRRKRSRR